MLAKSAPLVVVIRVGYEKVVMIALMVNNASTASIFIFL